ncbi:hypothetical protein PFISCL1PPCAC_17398, partial [Pristionchus fissidentatus]
FHKLIFDLQTMLRSLVLSLLALVSVSLAVRCFSSHITVPGPSSQMVVVDCPAAQFCFKSYIERSDRGQNSFTETRSCGNVGTCYETGCKSNIDSLNCCCSGDLCNGSDGIMGKALIISCLIPVALRYF